MKTNALALPEQIAAEIRIGISQSGYAVARVPDNEGYLAVCGRLGEVTYTRDILVSPERIQQYAGYSYDPAAVPFHTDNPMVGIVGLYCIAQDESGGENLLIDSRRILNELTTQEVALLTQIHVPLPKSDNAHPLLSTASDGMPHIYWLPALIQSLPADTDPSKLAAIARFDQLLQKCREERDYISIRLTPGEALWFNNYVMLHGRERLELSSNRHLVRAFVCPRSD